MNASPAFQQPSWLPAHTLRAIAASEGTPCYVYSRARLEDNFQRLTSAFRQTMPERAPMLHYAVKANSNPVLLELLHGLGARFDVVSVGELHAALRAGAPAAHIVFAGVGKRDDELVTALDAGVAWINVESIQELAVLSGLAAGMGRRQRVALRINPGVDPKTHAYLATGKSGSKFGLPIDDALALVRTRADYPGVSIEGLHVHNGSTISDAGVFAQSTEVMLDVVAKCRALGAEIMSLDLGGGFGVSYGPDQPEADIDGIARAIATRTAGSDLAIQFEPGRYLVADTCALITQVLYTKESAGKRYVIIDAAMNDLIRPALYGARHMIVALNAAQDAPAHAAEVVGPICESGDFLGHDVPLPATARGDVLAINHAGAYGRAMASNYNLRPRASEVLIETDGWRVIRQRERLETLLV